READLGHRKWGLPGIPLPSGPRCPHPLWGSLLSLKSMPAPAPCWGLSSGPPAAARAKCQKGSKHFILLIFFSFLIKLNSKTKIHKLLRRWLPLLPPTHTDTGHPTKKTKLL
uniref:Uncharacterized protein n=1 Tax=Panthera tigris altaica TaxID=74533 RepID=A0A8C9JER5_PANTA